jgi:prepilin-type processing-associated H-X9-DG protein
VGFYSYRAPGGYRHYRHLRREPALSRAKEKAKRTACVSNLKQMGLGSQMYCQDDSHGYFSGTFSDSDDDLTWLYPEYISSAKARSVFVCPSTQDFIGTNETKHPFNGRVVLTDMLNQAPYRVSHGNSDTDLRGVSYETFGFMNNDGSTITSHFYYGRNVAGAGGIKKSDKSTLAYLHKNSYFGLRGMRVGPTQIWLIVDGDRQGPGAQNNEPDANDDHGAEGGNVLMCDGHVQWIKGGKNYRKQFETSQDENTFTN